MPADVRQDFPAYTADISPTADGTATPAGPAPVFYGVDSRRISLREVWANDPKSVPVWALTRLLRVRAPIATDDPAVETLAHFEVPEREIPNGVRQQLLPLAIQLWELGFRDPVYHLVDDAAQKACIYLVTVFGPDGRTWARIHHRVWQVHTPARVQTCCEMISELPGGEFLWSVNGRPGFAPPAQCTLRNHRNVSAAQLFAAHQAELELRGVDHALPLVTQEERRAGIERLHAIVRDDRLARGLFVPLSADERASAAAFQGSVSAAAQDGSRHPEILAEIDAIQGATSSRRNGIILLLVSIVLFVGAGMTGAMGLSPGIVAMLVPAILLHEAGHWVAMRYFGYRNLKMFFIPFFGAAVTGQHYNVAGWKKAVVSLMGPLPGLVLGGVLGVIGVRLQQPLLVQGGLLLVLLNAFNMLPILPLDGGWVMQAILFSRHHWLELAFRTSAVVALVVAGAVTSDIVFLLLGIVMLLALPATYKMARITNELRRAQLPAVSEDGQSLPRASAEAIVERVHAAFDGRISNKVAAQYTLHVFENLNARSPGWLASLALGAVQLGALVASGMLALVLFAATSGSPSPSVGASAVEIVRTPGDSALATPRTILVATFDEEDAAASVLAPVARRAPQGAGVARIGQSVLVSFPATDRGRLGELQSRLQGDGAMTIVATQDAPAVLRLSCTLPSTEAVAALDVELNGYLAATGHHPVPPWQPGLVWSADDRAAFGRARATWLQLSRVAADVNRSPLMLAKLDTLLAAQRSGDTATVTRQRADLLTLGALLRRERVAAIRAEPGIDLVVADGFGALRTTGPAASHDSIGRAALAARLGQLPLRDGRPVPGVAEWSATGTTVATDRLFTAQVHFANTFQGATAFAQWMIAKGCTGMTSSFS